MQDNNYIVNSNNHIMDRNLYQQCSGAHVFRRMSCLISFLCSFVSLCACSRVRDYFPLAMYIYIYIYIYKRIVDAWMYMCVYVRMCSFFLQTSGVAHTLSCFADVTPRMESEGGILSKPKDRQLRIPQS